MWSSGRKRRAQPPFGGGREVEVQSETLIAMTAAVARYIASLQDHGGLKGTDIANFTDVSSATVHRWKAGTHLPHPATQLMLAQLHYIVSRLDDYYKPEEVRLWLYAPHPQLQGRPAIDAIVNGQAADVIAILDRLDAGVYL